MAAPPDRWSRWLLERRDAGDERQREVVLEHVEIFRDGVLALAEPLDGATVLDVGTGDGLIGLAALQRVGPDGRVIFADISEALLERARSAAGADDRAQSSCRGPRISRGSPTNRSMSPRRGRC